MKRKFEIKSGKISITEIICLLCRHHGECKIGEACELIETVWKIVNADCGTSDTTDFL